IPRGGCEFGNNEYDAPSHLVKYTVFCVITSTSIDFPSYDDTNPRSFGPEFNANGGGRYAMERTGTEISGNATAPVFLNKLAVARPQSIQIHGIIINLTLGGDLTGQVDVYRRPGCPGTCTSYVEDNPEAFKNAYFDFAWLKVYALHLTISALSASRYHFRKSLSL
ncbi:hypothetical protein MPER_04951, partial [Moniliophthora perniciosa FA553]